MRRSLRTLPLLALFAGLASPIRAHEYWLVTTPAQGGTGDSVAVRAWVGTGFTGEPKPWNPRRAERFLLRAGRTIDLAPVAMQGEIVWANAVLSDAGGATVVYESNFACIEMEPAKFDAYLRAEGLDEALAARQRSKATGKPGRERYARCCKSWIAGTRPERAQEPAGLPLEIVPLADPDGTQPIPVRVLYDSKPLRNALVRAWTAGSAPPSPAVRDSVGPAEEARTSADGTVTLHCRGPGEWLLNTVHMVPETSPEADWRSYWASYRFVRTAKSGDGRSAAAPRRP